MNLICTGNALQSSWCVLTRIGFLAGLAKDITWQVLFLEDSTRRASSPWRCYRSCDINPRFFKLSNWLEVRHGHWHIFKLLFSFELSDSCVLFGLNHALIVVIKALQTHIHLFLSLYELLVEAKFGHFFGIELEKRFFCWEKALAFAAELTALVFLNFQQHIYRLLFHTDFRYYFCHSMSFSSQLTLSYSFQLINWNNHAVLRHQLRMQVRSFVRTSNTLPLEGVVHLCLIFRAMHTDDLSCRDLEFDWSLIMQISVTLDTHY